MATISDILKLKTPTDSYLCEAKGYQYFAFVEFQVYSENQVYFKVNRPDSPIDWDAPIDIEPRAVDYQFDRSFLTKTEINTKLAFAVGPREIPNLRMIERHYHQGKLLRSYDFNFGFCAPNTVNTWESNYEVPKLGEKMIESMIKNPKQTVSDSFYFIEDELVLHNKATYSYY